ncbi:MAG: sulfite exporter TauE/SafE family protein, partial [Planctomycetota bacterium]
MDLVDQLILVGTGLGAGLMGGLLGIGGSVVMIPIIVHVVGRDQHFAQGAAMLVNVFVAIPAAMRHHKGGRVRMELVQWFAPTTVLFILCGVWLSNQFEDPKQLGLVFGVFMLAEVVNTLVKVIRPPND